MIVRMCDECGKQTHSTVEISVKDATVYFEGEVGRKRSKKAGKGMIKKTYFEIDLCNNCWPQGEPPQVKGPNVKIYWNPTLL